MNKKPTVLTVQDISCVGRCSMTVALPIISACGVETAVLPTTVLSTHTGISGPVIRDLTEDIPAISRHWRQSGVTFDCIYSGYLSSVRQMELVDRVAGDVAGEGCKRIIDPAMADHGRLYSGFDGAFVEAMKVFCSGADYLLPNLTEACLLTDTPYTPDYDEKFLRRMLNKLGQLGCRNVVLTGVALTEGETGAAVWDGKDVTFVSRRRLPVSYHGTGDIFASVFVGALARGRSPAVATALAVEFCADCIQATDGSQPSWRGVSFEGQLWKLGRKLLQKEG